MASQIRPFSLVAVWVSGHTVTSKHHLSDNLFVIRWVFYTNILENHLTSPPIWAMLFCVIAILRSIVTFRMELFEAMSKIAVFSSSAFISSRPVPANAHKSSFPISAVSHIPKKIESVNMVSTFDLKKPK